MPFDSPVTLGERLNLMLSADTRLIVRDSRGRFEDDLHIEEVTFDVHNDRLILRVNIPVDV